MVLKAYFNRGSTIRNQPCVLLAAAPVLSQSRSNYLGDEACRSCHAAQVESFHQTAHFLTSSAPTEKSILGKFTPGDNILKTVNPNLYFQMDAKEGAFFQTAVAGTPPHTHPRTERFAVVVGSGEKGQTYSILGRRSALSAPGVVLDQPGLGKQPRLSRRLCRFRARHHSPLPGVSRNLLSGPSSAHQPLQHHGFFPWHPVRKMSWPGKGTRGAREVQAAIPHGHPEPGAILPRPPNGSVRLVPRRPRPGAAALRSPTFPASRWTSTFNFPPPIPTPRLMCMATRWRC